MTGAIAGAIAGAMMGAMVGATMGAMVGAAAAAEEQDAGLVNPRRRSRGRLPPLGGKTKDRSRAQEAGANYACGWSNGPRAASCATLRGSGRT
jgi:hypothetical protein